MTGALLIHVGEGTESESPDSGLALEVIGTASGQYIHAQDSLTSSGTLSVDSLTYLNANTVITGNLNTTSNIAGSGTLSIEGISYLQDALNVTGAADFASTVSVADNLSGASLRIDGYSDLWGSLAVSGSTVIDSALTV